MCLRYYQQVFYGFFIVTLADSHRTPEVCQKCLAQIRELEQVIQELRSKTAQSCIQSDDGLCQIENVIPSKPVEREFPETGSVLPHGKMIAALRNQRGLNQTGLARKTKVSRSTVQYADHGDPIACEKQGSPGWLL